MRARHLIGGLTAVSLLAPTSAGIAQIETDRHHMGLGASPFVAAVRRATARFQDLDEAIAAGYVQNFGCVSGPEEGAMGVHYVRPALVDGQLNADTPELLVYEPRRGGGLDLVAVEYIAPADAWHAANPGVQPELMGQLFHFVPGPNRYGAAAFYELHVWAWKHNPHGTFTDWNPNVSCAAWAGD